MLDQSLSDDERFPLLTSTSRAMLRRLQQHPYAPRWTYRCGERLTSKDLDDVHAFAEQQRKAPRGWRPGQTPAWVSEFIDRCRREVPFYRTRLPGNTIVPCSREDIRREPWSFVPDTADVSRLIVYRTSGTSGNLLHLPAHPVAPARYLPLFQTAIAAEGASLTGGDRVSVIQVAAQQQTYTFASVSSYLNGAGYAKINLNPADWKAADDRTRFIDDCSPEILTGDPLAFDQLAALTSDIRPQAILSSATTLLPALRQRLVDRFACPVLDIYSLNETGPIAFANGTPDPTHFEVIPHNLFVEILDEHGVPLPAGVRGEIAVTGGINPYLPLVRYRTGDFASLSFHQNVPYLVGLEGRQPITFHGAGGLHVPSISVTVALFQIPLPFFALHQNADGSLVFRTRCDAPTEQNIRDCLLNVLGDISLQIQQVPWEVAWRGKSIQYSRDPEVTA